MSVLSHPRFHDEAAAFAWLEGELWANGTVCPHCGVVAGRVYDLSGVRGHKSAKNPDGAIRHGLKKCGECRKQFTVKVGTVFEHARMPLHLMLQAVHLISASKKGISSHQLSRLLDISYKAAWFLSHRIREAMADHTMPIMGGPGTIIEADETYIGTKKGVERPKGGFRAKMRVVSLVERETGRVRSIDANKMVADEVSNIVRANVDRETHLMTDEARHYWKVGKEFAAHDRVLHAGGEYVRGIAHTNTIEGYFSIFKRGMRGIYQHCSEKHLHRYLAEFDFRYSNRAAKGVDDRARANLALAGIVGKRLTYARPDC